MQPDELIQLRIFRADIIICHIIDTLKIAAVVTITAAAPKRSDT